VFAEKCWHSQDGYCEIEKKTTDTKQHRRLSQYAVPCSRLIMWNKWNSRDVRRVCAPTKNGGMCKAYPVKISTVLSLPPSFSCFYSSCICACMRLDIFWCSWMCMCLRVVCVSVRLCVCVSLRPCLFVSVCLRVCVSVCLCVCASVCLCFCLCLYLSVHMCMCVFALCACGGSHECGSPPV